MRDFINSCRNYIVENKTKIRWIYAGLFVLFITSVILAATCPPSVLAIGIGAWSLVGNILPLVTFAPIAIVVVGGPLLMIFDLCFMFHPVDALIVSLKGITASIQAMQLLGPSMQNAASQNETLAVQHFKSPLNTKEAANDGKGMSYEIVENASKNGSASNNNI